MADISVSKKLAAMAVDALEDRKGEDVKVLDISEISTLADYFIIASGSNITRYRLWLTVFRRSLEEKVT